MFVNFIYIFFFDDDARESTTTFSNFRQNSLNLITTTSRAEVVAYLVVDVLGCAASCSVDFQCCSKLRVRPASSSVTSSHDEPPDDLTTSGLSC